MLTVDLEDEDVWFIADFLFLSISLLLSSYDGERRKKSDVKDSCKVETRLTASIKQAIVYYTRHGVFVKTTCQIQTPCKYIAFLRKQTIIFDLDCFWWWWRCQCIRWSSSSFNKNFKIEKEIEEKRSIITSWSIEQSR